MESKHVNKRLFRLLNISFLRCDAVVDCFVPLNIQSRHLECQFYLIMLLFLFYCWLPSHVPVVLYLGRL